MLSSIRFYLSWRLLPFFDTVDRATAYQGTYEPSLVFLSLSIAVLARILVAEDNPVNQDVVVGLLQALGCDGSR